MVQPIASLTLAAPAPPASPQGPSAPKGAEVPSSPTPPQASPVSAGEERAKDGAFVYTLRDTDTGRLLVVIPHVELKAGSKLQTRV